MADGLFRGVYTPHYEKLPGAIYVAPLILIGLFLAIVFGLSFAKTDKVVVADGYILPRTAYVTKLTQRGFLIDNRTEVGRTVRAGEILASVQLDDGSIKNFTAAHAGVVIDTQLKQVIDGPLDEGSLIASVVDPADLRLQVELPARQRGTIKPGAVVRYKFDTFTQSARTAVEQHYITLSPDGQVRYQVYAPLAREHRQVHYLGKRLPVKLLVENVSLVDYFLNY